jgi:hypothetical protein
MPMVHLVQQYSEIVVSDDGHQYVARAYAAPRPDRRWDGWFVFLPFDGGRPLVTDWETTQSTLPSVKYWAEAITTVYLQGALRRAQACCSDGLLGRRAERAAQEEALAKAAAATYSQAAAAARAAAARAKHDRRDAEAQLLAERAAAARTAALLQQKKAAAARAAATEAKRQQRTFERGAGDSGRMPRPAKSAGASHVAHRRRE